MLNFLTKSLSLEIANFISFLKRIDISQKTFTKSAFVQARGKIKPEVFIYLNKRLIEEYYKEKDIINKKINGFRVLAIDGTRFTLPVTQELEKKYGKMRNQNREYVVQAKISVLYDVLNNMCLGGVFSPLSVGEREQAKELLECCQKGDLIIYDRGYPSFELIHEHYNRHLDFVIRVPLDFSNVVKEFVQSGKKSQIVEIHPSQNKSFTGKPYDKTASLKVRLLRIVLKGGGIEVLATSLLDSNEYKYEMFKELYFKRWKIETYYDELKNKLRIEKFSGYSTQSILQDFYAMLLVSNIQSMMVNELNAELQEEKKDKKYQYKINTALSYGFLKDRILTLLFTNSYTDEAYMELRKLFKDHLIPIRPNRTNERKVGKYRNRMVPIVPKNQKDNL